MRHGRVSDKTTLKIHAPSRIPTGNTKAPVVLDLLLFSAWNHRDRLFASPHCKELAAISIGGISCAVRCKA